MSTSYRAAALSALEDRPSLRWSPAALIPFVAFLLGGLSAYLGLRYLLFGLCALAFAYLLLFKIEVAFIIALLIHVELNRFNYLGGGTPFHPAGLLGVSLVFAALCYFLFRLGKIDFPRLRPSITFLLFFAICGLSLLRFGPHMLDRVTVMLRLAGGLAIFVVMLYTLDSIRKVSWTVGAIIASQIWPTLEGLLLAGRNTGLNYGEDTVRLGHSGLGVTESLSLTLCVVFLLNAKTAMMRLLMLGLTLLFAAGLFFTFGRAGWIGFCVALLVMGILKHRKLLILLPCFLLVLVLLVPGVRQRFSDISLDNLDGRGYSTLAGRARVWDAAIELTMSSPLTGVGYGMGRYRVGEHLRQHPWMIHNDYLSVLLETGLIGFVLFAVWQGQWLLAVLRVYRWTVPGYDQALVLGVAAFFISSLVMCLTDNLLLNAYRLFPVAGLVAATLALPRIRAQEVNRSLHS